MISSLLQQRRLRDRVEGVPHILERRSLIQEHPPLVQRDAQRVPAEHRILQQRDDDRVEQDGPDALLPNLVLLRDRVRLAQPAHVLRDAEHREEHTREAQGPPRVPAEVE